MQNYKNLIFNLALLIILLIFLKRRFDYDYNIKPRRNLMTGFENADELILQQMNSNYILEKTNYTSQRFFLGAADDDDDLYHADEDDDDFENDEDFVDDDNEENKEPVDDDEVDEEEEFYEEDFDFDEKEEDEDFDDDDVVPYN